MKKVKLSDRDKILIELASPEKCQELTEYIKQRVGKEKKPQKITAEKMALKKYQVALELTKNKKK